MDWTSFIAELQSHGLSQPQIAAVCGCGQATISDLASGKTKEPRDSLGQALRSLLDKCKAEKAGV
jgi:transcriptional regulator with XRE-family HTH domain